MKRMVALFFFVCVSRLSAGDIIVGNSTELRRAVSQAVPGTRILLSAGEFTGGLHFSNLRGESNRPIVLAAADVTRPPTIRGGGNGIHMSDAVFVELHHLQFTGWSANGVSIDDAGTFDSPARGIVLRGLTITNVGLAGNRDGIKLSGVDDFLVENCRVAGWGIGGGSGIDMVGCHRGFIVSNLFRHTDSAGSTGVQCKGGTTGITIQRNRFENAGGRGVNIGGSTGRAYFRPPLAAGQEHSEAGDIRVEGNTFLGGGAAMAFVGVDGAIVRFNTIYRPQRWALRILQETSAPDFIRCRNGVFTDNVIVFHSTHWSEGGVNIGKNTAPETFRFARNWWYCMDQASRSQPRLPTREVDGVYGRPVEFRDAANGDLQPAMRGEPLNVGASAFLPE